MNKNKCGAKPKFNVPTKSMRIERVVPIENHDELRELTDEFIGQKLKQLQSEALEKCVAEKLKNK